MFGVLFESERERKCQRLQAIVIEEVAAHNLKKKNELLTYQELAIWRRKNGFDRVAEDEETGCEGAAKTPKKQGALDGELCARCVKPFLWLGRCS